MQDFNFDPPLLSPGISALRHQVREFARAELADATPLERARTWTGYWP